MQWQRLTQARFRSVAVPWLTVHSPAELAFHTDTPASQDKEGHETPALSCSHQARRMSERLRELWPTHCRAKELDYVNHRFAI